VGALPRRTVPDGPVRILFDRLHELHHQAGWPSLREMAKEVGCSHTTISVAFSGPAVPRWGLVELIVETLGGDTAEFHTLWLAASAKGPQPPKPEAAPRPEAPRPPRQLPADVAGFTGRTGQLADLDRLLLDAKTSNAVVISAVSGTAGVGKTALAVHWAHRVAERFPDGQLYLNLRGYDPSRPVAAAEALEVFLRALGVEGAAIPQAVDERAARYRTLLAGRKMLVLLDNVHSIDQVRDLLPGTPSCLVLVTSREMLPALVARHGAVRINLDLLSETESVQLLHTLIGARVDAEPEQALLLANRCARLPLALRIAAELAVGRPRATLASLVTELGDESRRLDLLAAGDDDYTAVRTVFSWSCQHLSDEAVAAFRLLGLHPGQDIGLPAAAALIGTDPAEASRLLDTLTRAHLVEERGTDRFDMHDLLRAYAAEQASTHHDHRAALIRLFEHYLETVTSAMAAARLPGLSDRVFNTYRDWFAAERANLCPIADRAFHVSPEHLIRLSVSLAYVFDTGGYYRDGLFTHQLALRAAVALRDRDAEAAAHDRLGRLRRRTGSYLDAIEHHRQALDIYRATGNLNGQGASAHGLGLVCRRLGRYADAREHLEESLAISHKLSDRQGEAAALYALGTVFLQLGHYSETLDHQRRALAIQREIGDRLGEGRTLNNMGLTLNRLGRPADALEHFEQALAVSEAIGNRIGTGVALLNLGVACTKLDRFDDALSHHTKALTLFRDIGYRVGEASGLHELGELYRRTGRTEDAISTMRQAIEIAREVGEAEIHTSTLIDLGKALGAEEPDAAEDAYREGLAIAERTGDRYEQARALDGLADLTGDARYRQEALALFTELGVPEARVGGG
jgi:tetratricopeptide (TPR) repeat protein